MSEVAADAIEFWRSGGISPLDKDLGLSTEESRKAKPLELEDSPAGPAPK